MHTVRQASFFLFAPACCAGYQRNEARLLLCFSPSPSMLAPSPGYLQKGKGQHTKVAMEKDGGISREEMTRAISVW